MTKTKTEQALEAAQVRGLLASNSDFILGIDEVGTGAWAGPIVVGAVVLPSSWYNREVKDSKKYSSHPSRVVVYRNYIKEAVLFAETIEANVDEIYRFGFNLVMDDLIHRLVHRAKKSHPNSLIVLDGNRMPPSLPGPAITLPKADILVPAVSAASILAKIHRDEYMHRLDKEYPAYGFIHNVGYGTPEHKEAIIRNGLCPEHRRAYRPIRELQELWVSSPRPNETQD